MANLVSTLARKLVMEPVLDRMDRREAQILDAPASHRWDSESPVRFHIMREALKRGAFDASRIRSPMMMRSLLGIFKSIRDLKQNRDVHKTQITDADLRDLISLLKSLGVTSAGFTRVPARWVFKDKAIMYANAIVTTMEMDPVRIATAPSKAAGQAVHEIYCYQGLAMIKAAQFLRRRGYAAQAGHPLMGMALYPPLAQMAGLGQLGVSGLLITPEHGPRVRLAAIFTDIENLPFQEEPNSHEWILDYCAGCQVCVKKCPEQAIFPEPRVAANGRITCVDNERCFPYFMENDGCSVCVKICPFNTTPYEKLRQSLESTSAKTR